MIAARWDAFSPRDQRMLGGGAIVVVVLLGWAFLWHPLALARERLEREIAGGRSALAWMRAAQGEVPGLSAHGARGAVDRQGKSLLALADVTARGASLGSAPARVEPTGPRSVRVSLEKVNFDALVGWVETLARDYGVQASDLSVERVESLGLVNARVTLEDP
ncbi:MAG: type II secretion system protein M [Rudaea sp.]